MTVARGGAGFDSEQEAQHSSRLASASDIRNGFRYGRLRDRQNGWQGWALCLMWCFIDVCWYWIGYVENEAARHGIGLGRAASMNGRGARAPLSFSYDAERQGIAQTKRVNRPDRLSQGAGRLRRSVGQSTFGTEIKGQICPIKC